MKNKSKEYDYFLSALRDFDSRFGWGAKSAVAEKSGYTPAYVSLILTGEKRPSFDAQVVIANACGFDYLDFLRLGREIVEKRPGGKLRELQAVSRKYPPEMQAAIDDMDRIRKGDIRAFDRLTGQIRAMADALNTGPPGNKVAK
jgi:transcriptional regulator with XRE-family HTH domain